MPTNKRAADELPPPGLMLAAIERAERHQRNYRPGASRADIKEHLGLAPGSWSTRQLRPTWDKLQADGLIEEIGRQGIIVWALTDEGRTRLEATRNEIGSLPESPQHSRWREARRAAEQRISKFHAELRHALNEAESLLHAGGGINSETWYELGQRLQRACGTISSATYCLHEWTEPDDSHADIDNPPYGQGGRREIRGWDRLNHPQD